MIYRIGPGKALLVLALGLSACSSRTPPQTAVSAPAAAVSSEAPVSETTLNMYETLQDGDITIPAVQPKHLSERNKRQEVDYWTDQKPGSIIVDPWERFLFYVLPNNRALRYGVGVGAAGKSFAGEAKASFGREWPKWTPTPDMIRKDPETYGPVKDGVPGGIENPLGARALYLVNNGVDTLYRIHGTKYPGSIGRTDSDGCIRLYNQDIIDLYDRVNGRVTNVLVLEEHQSGQGTRPPGSQMMAEGGA